MMLVGFPGANDGTVWVNPAEVVRVEPGSWHYNLTKEPRHRTLIVQTTAGVFVDEDISLVVAALESHDGS